MKIITRLHVALYFLMKKGYTSPELRTMSEQEIVYTANELWKDKESEIAYSLPVESLN